MERLNTKLKNIRQEAAYLGEQLDGLPTPKTTHFLGFVDGQMKRLLGEKGRGKHGQQNSLYSVHL